MMMKDMILQRYEIRKSNKEKTDFIEYIKERLSESGYDKDKDITIETKGKGLLKSRNIVVGNPKGAEVVVTAHYDTCAIFPFPNIMAPTNPILFVVIQIIVAIVLFVLAGVITLIFALLTNNYFNAGSVYLVVLLLMMYHMMFGYRNAHTANDNTSGVIAVTQLLEGLAPEHRNKVCVVYFDNEEKGLFGSSFFAKKYKNAMKNKMLINLDCVGDGKNIVLMAKRKARKDAKYPILQEAMNHYAENYDGSYLAKKMQPMMFPSDQVHFENAIGVCALHKSVFGMYCARIHTPFDTVCKEENINFLTSALIAFVEKIQK